jgi:diaminopimelate epimerase
MGPMHLVKIQGAGNDFLFIDLRNTSLQNFTSLNRSEVVRRVSNREFGIGADGVVFVENGDAHVTFNWDFYNKDGSTAEMCGNAARCMGRWGQLFAGKTQFSFRTIAGVVLVRGVDGVAIEAFLPFVNIETRNIDYKVDGETHKALFVNTGVPHLVVEVAKIEQAYKMLDHVQALRFHPEVGQRGSNVTFVERVTESKFKTVTFERGVEGFTLACGTGVLASAAKGIESKTNVTVEVEAPGGKLQVVFPKDGGAILTGPAELVFEAKVNEELLK